MEKELAHKLHLYKINRELANSNSLLIIRLELTLTIISTFNSHFHQMDKKITITVHSKVFDLQLENNSTAEEWKERLPIRVKMKELNNNEKYFFLEKPLVAFPKQVNQINQGDVMLYGDNCLVIFYKSFRTTYSYTKIGHITLTKGLGQGDIWVQFK
jgi:hypothetical protein